MATVHRQPGSPYYSAFYRIPVGRNEDGSVQWKQVKKSTRKKGRSDAVAAATEMERMALKEAGVEDERGRKFMEVLRDAADDGARGMLTEAMARDYLDRIAEIATGKPVQVHSVEVWFKSWLADKSRSRSNGTAVRYKGVVESFLSALPASKLSAPLASLTVEEVRSFRDTQLDSGKSASTANLAVKTLSMALGLARRQGIIKVNPAEAIDRVEKHSFEKDVFSLEQVQMLLKNADGEWKGVILCGFFTGARLRDITNLKWENVDMTKGILTFRAAKTGKGLLVPLHASLKQYFSELQQPKTQTEPIFRELSTKSTSGVSGLSMGFKRIMKLAGISGSIQAPQGKKGRNRSSLTFHSLRHTFASQLANLGVSAELRRKLTGHLDAKTHENYTHHEVSSLRNAVDLLGAL